ncbi:MAG: hypothetical protein P9L97_06010 [Candidatus Tenebribacter davisii]|nr:hypothetical protein [Candidatus Tenebribacter davisii]
MKLHRDLNLLHPHLHSCVKLIQSKIIDPHNVPIRIFETGRDHERHQMLLKKGKTTSVISKHWYNLENSPPLYATAISYVYFDTKWSWNLRDSTTNAWYNLFGNLVLDLCPELQWGGYSRKSVNFCHFELSRPFIIDTLSVIPCVLT